MEQKQTPLNAQIANRYANEVKSYKDLIFTHIDGLDIEKAWQMSEKCVNALGISEKEKGEVLLKQRETITKRMSQKLESLKQQHQQEMARWEQLQQASMVTIAEELEEKVATAEQVSGLSALLHTMHQQLEKKEHDAVLVTIASMEEKFSNLTVDKEKLGSLRRYAREQKAIAYFYKGEHEQAYPLLYDLVQQQTCGLRVKAFWYEGYERYSVHLSKVMQSDTEAKTAICTRNGIEMHLPANVKGEYLAQTLSDFFVVTKDEKRKEQVYLMPKGAAENTSLLRIEDALKAALEKASKEKPAISAEPVQSKRNKRKAAKTQKAEEPQKKEELPNALSGREAELQMKKREILLEVEACHEREKMRKEASADGKKEELQVGKNWGIKTSGSDKVSSLMK